MKKTFYLFSIAFLFSFNSVAQSDSAAVTQCFEKYKKAILNDQGETAYSVLDKKTLAYYDEIIEKIKAYDSVKIEGESIMNKITILLVRHRASAEEIINMDGRKLLIYSINNGMVGKNSVANNSTGKVTVIDNFATAVMVQAGKPTPLNYEFNKEDGNWKFNLTSIYPLANVTFKKLVEQSEMSENEFIFYILENLTGRKPTAGVWKPIKLQ